MTIDPARRLADALGLDDPDQLGPRGSRDRGRASSGPSCSTPRGPSTTWSAATRPRPSRPRSILANRIYRNLTGALSGTQEYMAMEKLYELAEEGGFDLVVVDTPPTRNALDFLDAPRRLTRFLGHRLFQCSC